MELSVIIVNWNTRDLLRACLKSIAREIRGLTFEIFVVDNASRDRSVEMVQKEFPSVCLIANSENAGFGRANNQAYRESKGEYVLFLNPDTEIRDRAVNTMIEFMKSHPNAWLVGPRAVHPDGTIQVSWSCFPSLAMVWTNGVPLKEALAMFPLFRKVLRSEAVYTNEGYTVPETISSRSVDYVLGQCLLTRRSVLEKVGVFDESIFMYEEEADLCYRIHRAGGQVWFVNEAEILHHERQSIRQLPNELKEEARWFIHARAHFFKKYRGPAALYLFHTMTVLSTIFKLIVFSVAILIDPKKKNYLKRKRQYHACMGLYYIQRLFGKTTS